MQSRTRDPYRSVPARALALSAGALAVPLLGTMVFGDVLGEQEPLLWLLALVPAFLLAYYRGWRGASVALAAVMAALALAHAGSLWLGRGLPDGPLLLVVAAAVILSTLGAGWTAELLHRRFLLAQEHAMGLTLVVDDGGRVRYASPSSRRILGLEPGSLEQRLLADVVHPRMPVPNLAESAGGLVQLEVPDAEGAVRVLEATVVDRRSNPRVGGWVLRARDVTERVRAEEQHRRLYRMQAITQLARALAHDFNNVLTTIRGHAHLLQDELDGDTRVERPVQEILEATQRASNFVDQLLAFTRQQVLRPRPVDLNELLMETRPRLQELVGGRTRIELELEPDLPRVLMDPAHLRRILLILGSRAGEQMPEGGRLIVSTRPARITEADARSYPYPVLTGDYAVLCVADTGPELTESVRSLMFEPFVAGVGEDATGLELSGVYGTVKQSGGYVWVDGREGGGAEFRLYLPLAGVEEESVVVGSEIEAGGRGMVLVAEDDAHVRALVSRVLLKEGYYVLEAADGEEALRLAEHLGRRLDLVVADMAMPRMGGRELGAALLGDQPDLPILYMSGQPDLAPQPELGGGPEPAFIQKPFSPGELAAKLRTLYAGAPR
jgi:PAS domain S-box-containing protein